MLVEARKKDVYQQKSVESPPDVQGHNALNQLKDGALWQLFKAGNRPSFILIYDRYFEEMFVFAQQFTSDHDLIKDTIQDLFVRLFETRERLGNTDSIKFYLFKSLKHDLLRIVKHKIGNYFTFDENDAFQFELPFEDTLLNQQTVEESKTEIRNAANSLKHRQREIIFYYFFEGFSFKQIKELMGMTSQQSVHNLISKAIKNLRISLKSKRNDISFPG